MDIACTVNNELEKLDIWSRVNKLSLNVNKPILSCLQLKNNIDQQ